MRLPWPEGGFGWSLIHVLATQLRYRRVAGKNWLIVAVPLGAE